MPRQQIIKILVRSDGHVILADEAKPAFMNFLCEFKSRMAVADFEELLEFAAFQIAEFHEGLTKAAASESPASCYGERPIPPDPPAFPTKVDLEAAKA